MSLTLRTDYNTVSIGGRNVKLVDNYDNRTMVNRFVETLAYGSDETAVNYILNTDYEDSDAYTRNVYNEYTESLNRMVKVVETFSLETNAFGINIGAGFSAVVKEKNFDASVGLIENMMHVLGLDRNYRLVARYENQAVYAIVRN